MSRSNGRPRRVEDWFRLVPNLLDDAGWDFKVYEPQTNLSHAACPWGGRLVKVILSKFEVRHPPEQMNCMLVRPELFGTGPSVLAPGEVVLRRPRRAWGINDTSVLFEEMAGSCECRMSPLRLEPMVTHQRFRRDYPSEGDSAYAVFNEGDDPQEGMLLCCWRGPGASGVLVDVVKIFCIPEETFCCWSDLHFQLILDSMRRACHLMLNGPACGELRVMDERLYIVLTIQSCKRGLPLYPLKEGSKQDPTVVISAGQHLQLQRWRRFQTNPVTGEKFRLSKYLAQFLANLEKDLAVYETLDGRSLVPYQCAVSRHAWNQIREHFIACFLVGKTAYRRANGGSTAPTLHEVVEPRFLHRFQEPPPVVRAQGCQQGSFRMVVRNTFVEVEEHSEEEQVHGVCRRRRRPKTTTVLPTATTVLAN